MGEALDLLKLHKALLCVLLGLVVPEFPRMAKDLEEVGVKMHRASLALVDILACNQFSCLLNHDVTFLEKLFAQSFLIVPEKSFKLMTKKSKDEKSL